MLFGEVGDSAGEAQADEGDGGGDGDGADEPQQQAHHPSAAQQHLCQGRQQQVALDLLAGSRVIE